MTDDLAGVLVVVSGGGDATARAARLAGELRDRGGRVVVFASEGDADDADAIVELVGELARPERPGAGGTPERPRAGGRPERPEAGPSGRERVDQ